MTEPTTDVVVVGAGPTGLLLAGDLAAARRVLAGVATGIAPVNRRMAGTVSGIDTTCPARQEDHSFVGHRVPDVALAEGGRLYGRIRPDRFVLLGGVDDDVAGWADRVEHVTPAAGAPPV